MKHFRLPLEILPRQMKENYPFIWFHSVYNIVVRTVVYHMRISSTIKCMWICIQCSL